MDLMNLIRDEIKNLVPYEPNKDECKIKLDANESPYDMPEIIKKEVIGIFSDNTYINQYPDTDSNELRAALALKWGIDKNMIMVGNGSDQVIQVLSNTFIGKGDRIVCQSPSFSMYGLSAQINGGKAIEYKMKKEDGFELDIDDYIKFCELNKPKVIYICNPNNPTGGFIPVESIKKVLEVCQNSIVVVDEAYNEFLNTSCIDLLKKYKNLVILRTFSKAFGLAGVRCGYSLASREITDYFNRVRPPYNLNSLTQRICTITLKYQKLIDEYVDKINTERGWLYDNMLSIDGIKVYKTYANFFLIELKDSEKVFKDLLNDGILVRNYGGGSVLKDFIRVSVGTREQNRAFLESLKRAVV